MWKYVDIMGNGKEMQKVAGIHEETDGNCAKCVNVWEVYLDMEPHSYHTWQKAFTGTDLQSLAVALTQTILIYCHTNTPTWCMYKYKESKMTRFRHFNT